MSIYSTAFSIIAGITLFALMICFWAWLKMKDDKADVLRRSALEAERDLSESQTNRRG